MLLFPPHMRWSLSAPHLLQMNQCRKQWVIDRAVEDTIAIELQNIRFYVFFHGYVIQLNKYK